MRSIWHIRPDTKNHRRGMKTPATEGEMPSRRTLLWGAFLPAVLVLTAAAVHPSTVARGCLSDVEGQILDIDGRPLSRIRAGRRGERDLLRRDRLSDFQLATRPRSSASAASTDPRRRLLADVRGRGHGLVRHASRRRGPQASAGVPLRGHSRRRRPIARDRETARRRPSRRRRWWSIARARSATAAASTTSMRRLGSRGSRSPNVTCAMRSTPSCRDGRCRSPRPRRWGATSSIPPS